MTFWIPLTLAAAFLQNLRSASQKHLKSAMGTTGATFVRFAFGLPFALVFLALVLWHNDSAVPSLHGQFMLWVLLGAFAQIGGTFLLVHMFSYRNFAVGTAYSRTEPAQAALFGLIFLGDRVTFGVLGAIGISVLGVMLISVAHVRGGLRDMAGSIVAKSSLIGLSSGAFFGVSGVAYRGASLSLGGPDFMTQAAVTLVATLLVQVLGMGLWILWRERAELGRIAKAWKVSLFAGAMGASASFCWFAAMTLQNAAQVKALGQIEMLFTFAATVFFFRERINRLEVVGCALISLAIVFLLVAG